MVEKIREILDYAEQIARDYQMGYIGVGAVLCSLAKLAPEVLDSGPKKVETSNIQELVLDFYTVPFPIKENMRFVVDVRNSLEFINKNNLPRNAEGLAYGLLIESDLFIKLLDSCGVYVGGMERKLEFKLGIS